MNMQSDLSKLFIGGISWDTNEERLKEYFSSYGEVVEAVIMKDRNTGRARGFGFVVFADPAAGERVIKEKHNIDGRMVEAKKAVPKDDQNTMIRSTSSVHGSPGQGRTKKIFVGGLASSVTESDFKQYFEQFGTITDVVVMHDHNTQRPRGFGFITFELEDAVDNVLLKTFHELNGKMVEVKRAVPKELSPGPSRSPLGGFNYNMSRVNNFLDGFTQVGNFGRFNSIATGRNAFTPFGSGYGTGLNYEQGMATSYGGNANFSSNLNYGRGPNPYFIGNSNRFGNPIGYDDSNSGGNTSLFNSMSRDLWGNNLGLNCGTNSANGNIGGGAFGNSGVNWGNSSPISSQRGGNNISRPVGINLGYGLGDGNFSLGTGGYGRNIGANMASISSSYGPSNGGFNGALTDFNGGGSGYGDHTWRTVNSERDESDLFGYALGSVASDASLRSSPSIVGGYSANKRQANRGVPPISSLVETEKGFHMDAMGLLRSEDH